MSEAKLQGADETPRAVESRSDGEISMEKAIQVATRNGIYGLRVVVTQERVTLIGRCNTFFEKQLAQEAAMTLGVEHSLINSIEVATERGLSIPLLQGDRGDQEDHMQ